ncbi:MAG: tRNA 4-thiouridine(8) synthase ThiI [Deltaproteobacteria bacterium]|nr:tRNA 4-thiouridine(8) synthase ThiI [Deltaproteobacteria bacterium]
MNRTIRALGLFSGGLDSMLAAAVLRRQGIDVTGVTFITPFFGAERARQSAAHLGMPLLEVDLTEKFLPLIYRPPRGFGRYHNPCLDCHILMIREAGDMMAKSGFDFLFTGEVLGQRPMSQHRGALNSVAKESGYGEVLLRPLSAKLLPPTKPELLGWVDRERLLDISGRGRKRQMALAREYGITEYPSPAGGCLLTDPRYSARLKELLARSAEVSRQDLELLKWGRHFRLPTGKKAIVGRTHKENEAIASLKHPADLICKIKNFPGPTVLVPGSAGGEEAAMAAALTAAYSDAPEGQPVTVKCGENEEKLLHLIAPAKDNFKEWLI